MPATALSHFQQDIARARAIVAHADSLPSVTPEQRLLRGDLLRSAWMFAVAALDAYFCDAYTDVVAVAVSSKSRHPAMVLPEFFYEIKFPIRAILEPYANNVNWRWRMAARKMMDRENVLSLRVIQLLFNKFFRPGQRFFRDLVPNWIGHRTIDRRLVGITSPRFNALPQQARGAAIDKALRLLEARFQSIFQRRHDCIHNCDRPKISIQPLATANTVVHVINDIDFLVCRCDEHINSEFRQFLLDCGCPLAVVRLGGY